MQITDVTGRNLDLFCVCLEDWNDEARETGDRKRVWYETMKQRGVGAKLALDDEGNVGGMILYAPIEHSIVAGRDLYFIYCIWVHGYRKGRGVHRFGFYRCFHWQLRVGSRSGIHRGIRKCCGVDPGAH